MRAPAVSSISKIVTAAFAVLLIFALVPVDAFAEGESASEGGAEAVASDSSDQPNDSDDSSAGELQAVSAEQDAEGSPVAPMLASGLVGKPGSFINSDVALDSEPVIGSFTVDGLTFAVIDGPYVELVGVASSVTLREDGEAGVTNLALPEAVFYEDVSHIVSSVGAYAFYLSDAPSVTLPASISSVDARAFRSSDVASVQVADNNPFYSSFDGALYDADQLSLLLIPEGKQGAVLLPKTAEAAEASVFSHCPLVDSISVEKDGAAFASENGLLYTSDLTTLLRVPVGATEITIREGCTTIAAGALEACANLTTINAPATVTAISPDVFTAIPTVSLLAASLAGTSDLGATGEPSSQDTASQLNAMVALSSVDDDLPEIGPVAIALKLSTGADAALWRSAGFTVEEEVAEAELDLPVASLDSAFVYAGGTTTVNPNGGSLLRYVPNVGWDIDTTDSVTTPTWQTFYVSGGRIYNTTSNGQWIARYADIYAIGWSRVSSGGTLLQDGYRFSSTEGVVYARYPENISVMFNVNTTDPKAKLGTTGVKGTVAQMLPNITCPIRPGYDFVGYFSSAGKKYYDSDGIGIEKWDKEEATTLYARWFKKDIYTVTLNPRLWASSNATTPLCPATSTGTAAIYYWAGRGWYNTANPSDTAEPATTGTTLIAQPTLAGYTYKGYRTGKAGSGVQKMSGAKLSSTAAVSSDATWYAEWQKNAIQRVYIQKNAGTDTVYKTVYLWYGKGWYSSSSPNDSSTALTTIGTPTWPGRTYKGFATSSTATFGSYWAKVTDFPSSENSDLGSGTTAKTTNLYAVWEGNEITLSWNPHNGQESLTTEQTHSTTETTKVELPTAPEWEGRTFAGWFTAASGGTQVTSSTALPTANATYYAHWSLNPYAIAYDLAGGSVSGNPTTYDVTTTTFTLKNPTRTGYAFAGWSGTGLSGSANKTVTIAKGSTGNRAYTANWSAKPYTVEYWDKAGATKLSSDTGFRYDTARALAGKPSSGLSAGYTALGWARSAGQSSAAFGFGSSQSNLATSGTVALYLAERPNPYTIAFDTQCDLDVADVSATYDQDVTLPAPSERKGYIFNGWNTEADGSGNAYEAGVALEKPNLVESGTVTLYAQWSAAISADAPVDATVRVDLLGIEGQAMEPGKEGYIESRSGAPLKVESVAFTREAGAEQLFGSSFGQVSLQALAGDDASWATGTPAFSFALDAVEADAIEDDEARLAPFAMAGYEARIPISYRFDIPSDVLAAIDPARFEQVTTSVCSVAYTVALQSPPQGPPA